MRYCLRALLIQLAAGPPMLAGLGMLLYFWFGVATEPDLFKSWQQ
jgi:hypothetical protein